jgi:transposase
MESAMNGWVGIDVSKATLDVVLVRAGDSQHTQVSNTKAGFRTLENFLKKRCREKAHVCLEATGLYGDAVAEFLHERGYTVSVVNPARIKAYGDSQLKRNKTDRSDAALIADFCRTQQPAAWHPPAPEVKELRAMLRHLDDLQAMRQQEANRLQSGEQSAPVLAQLQQHLAFLDSQIDQIKHQIDDHFDQHPPLKHQRDLLSSIPGIGHTTAGRLLAELRDLSAFETASQVAAFVGVTPRQHQSGTSIRRASRISKQGNPALRAALYMPAVVAQRWNPLVRDLAQRLEARGHCKMSIIVAAMHKLLHLAFGVLKSGQPFDPLYLEKRLLLT